MPADVCERPRTGIRPLLKMTFNFSSALLRRVPMRTSNPLPPASLPSRAVMGRFVASALLAFGCSDGAASSPADDESDGTGPVYAVTSQIFDADGERTVYVELKHSLEIDEISLDGAQEFHGVANIAGIGGRLFVSDGESPTITQYSITDDLEWIERGRVGFQDYGVGDNANFFGQFQLDDNTMYLNFDVAGRVVWDPMNLTIQEVLEDTELQLTSGKLTLSGAGNHSRLRYAGNTMQAFFYHDVDWYDFGTTSAIAVYDRATHEEVAVLDGPCPGLAVNSMDEQGNTYFSAWDYTPLFALYGVGPAPCVARVTSEGKLDRDFESDLSPLTGGRHLMNFRYVRDGWGFADVLHDELLDADFESELDVTVLDQIWEGGAFKLWRIDLEHGQAEPFEDVGDIGMGWRAEVIDGRTFLFVPSTDWSTTMVFELDADGAATKLLEAPGTVSFLRIR